MRSVLLIRSLLLWFYLIVFTVPYGTMCLVIFPLINTNRRYHAIVQWCRLTLWMLRIINGINYRINGLEHLPAGPAVLLSKHQSAWETLAFPALIPHPLCFVLKRELLFIPFFGWALSMLKMVHINRNEIRRAFASILQQGRARLAAGAWIVIFPEGTRTLPGEQQKYKVGGARLAVEIGVPIIPIAHNAGCVWPRHSFIKYPGIVTVSIGQPIETTGLTAHEANARVIQWIEAEMKRIDKAAMTIRSAPR